jgi:hypothetical protein
MGLTNAGRNFIAQAIMNDSPTFFDNTHAYLCVGDGTTAFAATQTDLQGSNKTRGGMDTGYPTRADNVLTFKATFDGNTANHDWDEWGVANASSAGTLLNRMVEDNGTKVSGQTWVLEVDLTISIGS